MVAYSFKARFEPSILAGSKRQTIRAERKRHAMPGEQLQLYVGMRTKYCRLIGRSVCTGVHSVRLDFQGRFVSLNDGASVLQRGDSLDAFAVSDGFADWGDMRGFWAVAHPNIEVFTGVLIRWGDLLPKDKP